MRAIAEVADGRDLTRAEAREVMAGIMAGEATQAQIAGFLVALRAKGETADEIAGCAEAMREHVLPVRPERNDVVDVVGTVTQMNDSILTNWVSSGAITENQKLEAEFATEFLQAQAVQPSAAAPATP